MSKTFIELLKSDIEKFNPYHDRLGRFTFADGAASFTYKPGASTAHDNAIAREKARTANGGGGGETRELTADEKSAVEHYVSGDGMWINQALRGKGDFGELSENEKEYLKDLDSATQSSTVTQTTLYRAVDASAIFGNISDIDFENLESSLVYGINNKATQSKVNSMIDGAKGKTVEEKGFMSTTTDKQLATDWNGYTGSNKDIVVELNVPKGTKGRDLKSFDVEGDEQNEVLLSRGQRYKVTDISSSDGKIYVKADIISN